MTTTGRELVRQVDVDAATAEIRDLLRRGDARAASEAIAQYVPVSQALVVRSTFIEEQRARPGEKRIDALRRAGRAVERVVEIIPDETAREAVRQLDTQVLGAVLSAAAGEATSAVALHIEPERLEKLLASSLELWTVMDVDQEDRVRGINVPHLIHVLWTIFQTDDERARQLLSTLNPDLVAYPIARELVYVRDEVNDAGESEALDAEESGGDPFEVALRKLREGADEGPEKLGIEEPELRDLLDRIYVLDAETYRCIIRRAQEMDLADVREELERNAEERASGGEPVHTSDVRDDMFAPLDPDPPKGG